VTESPKGFSNIQVDGERAPSRKLQIHAEQEAVRYRFYRN
jgi:hypothetical protein